MGLTAKGLTANNVVQAAWKTLSDFDTFINLTRRITGLLPGRIAEVFHSKACIAADIKLIPDGCKEACEGAFDDDGKVARKFVELPEILGTSLSYGLRVEKVVEGIVWPVVAVISLFAIPYIFVPALSLNLFLSVGYGGLSLASLFGVTHLAIKSMMGESAAHTEVACKRFFKLVAMVSLLAYAILSFGPTVGILAGLASITKVVALVSASFGALSLFCKNLDKLDNPQNLEFPSFGT